MRKIIAFAIIMMVGITFAFYIDYKVQAGDTLYDLSKNFNIPIPVLMDWNPSISPSNLKIGQTLKIPLVSGIMYKPSKALTLSALAKYFFIDPEEITSVNPSIGSNIPANKEVFVPVGKVNTSFTQLADFVWPAYGSITSEFGWRLHPIYNKNMFHSGIDIGVPLSTPVFAARGGTVKYAGWQSGYGNVIIIDHGGYQTYYAHLSKINVYVGLRVEKGDFIARSGNTGTSTGPHLHFEVRKNDEPNDPVAYLPRTNTYVMRRVFSE
ncbi:MAG TPA: M23 family metallopeptidase [Fervidobacterium sp.]|nr:M23 family metallopeptidase [Fervidobacterium sp.]HPT53928.1 M23 family metallopeptidase [Fervidobacterium sp.]HPZ17047.1 M23 family metallopeptidase [Fervidobacterium sp.]HQE48010.1 M23 family metallopeptidase [Fervidobacterium sp.]HUM41650.1 M23 family metallopeptidase [Fervidobacterium sp.]